MADSIHTHPRLGAIRLASNRRTRRITLTVKSDGTIRLSYPPHIPHSKALAFLEEREEWIVATQRRLAERLAQRPVVPAWSREEVEAMRQQAKADLPPRVERLAQQFGFQYGRITIRASRSKWGCCTASNNLSLSLFLMILPEHLRDFVLLHELCHTVHHNHSPRFHALLDRCVEGRERLLNRELRNYPIR